jgi:hypothetical protein
MAVAAIAVRAAYAAPPEPRSALTVHHATILEMNVDSYRRRVAEDRAGKAVAAPTTTIDSLIDNHEGTQQSA